MAEMLMKAVLVERGKSILEKPKMSVDLRSALRQLGPPSLSENIEILREHRDNAQHFAIYADDETVRDLFEGAVAFAESLVSKEWALDLRAEAGFEPKTPAKVESVLPGTPVDVTTAEQRDADFEGGVLVWAQADELFGNLRLRVRFPGRRVEWLSPSGAFEYMPRTDGHVVAAYRQSGGIVGYDLDRETRVLLSETGGPNDFRDGFVAAQGVGLPDGLGGGIWLVRFPDGETEQISVAGDSPRIDQGRIYWQELRSNDMEIRCRSLKGGQTETVVRPAGHFAISDGLLAWVDHGPDPRLWALEIASGERALLAVRGFAPAVRRPFIAGLVMQGGSHDLFVTNWPERNRSLSIEDAGFPTGRGPTLTDTEAIWESGRATGLNHLRWAPLPKLKA